MSASRWRTVRVFISSTFRDMHAERDWLIKRVFPALRERLEPHRVHLVDIDLRWGVTEQQAESGGALDVCLDNIDTCRPFFLGLLGERYGWVPEGVPDRVTSKWGWIRHTTQKSITELEILHGVLNNPEMQRHAFFCFRDPAFMKDVPAAKRCDLEAESSAAAEKLLQLKSTIRASGLPLLDPYACRYAGLRINWNLARGECESADRQALETAAGDGLITPTEYKLLDERSRDLVHRSSTVAITGLEEFGRRIHDWLWTAIAAELELADQPVTTAAADSLSEEADYHERFMESRLRVYIGRVSLQQRLFDFIQGTSEIPCLVTGPSGSGKSAALANFIRECRTGANPPRLIAHFVGASPASTSLRQMLHRFCSELKQQFQFAEAIPADTNSLTSLFRRFLEAIPPETKVVLVIDALNQLDESENALQLYWLPWKLPRHVKLIASCIEDPGREEPVLKAFARRDHVRIAIDPLTDAERVEIIREVPLLAAKTLDQQQVRLFLDNAATTNPLFLLVALEELRGFGSYEQLNRRIADFPQHGDTVTLLFRQVIERLELEFDAEVVKSILTLLATARRGLSDRELLELIEGAGATVLQSTSDLFPVLRQLRPYLQHRGRLWDFFHRNLYKAVRAHYLDSDEALSGAHERLANFFRRQEYFLESLEEQRARARRLPPTPRPANVRKVDELPFQVLEIAKLLGKDDAASPYWDAVADLFTELHFLEAKVEAQPEGLA